MSNVRVLLCIGILSSSFIFTGDENLGKSVPIEISASSWSLLQKIGGAIIPFFNAATEHNEGGLLLSTLLMRYKLYQWQEKVKIIEKPKIEQTINVITLQVGSDVSQEEINRAERLRYLLTKPEKQKQICAEEQEQKSKCTENQEQEPRFKKFYKYSREFRTFCKDAGEGLDAAHVARALSFSDRTAPYAGVSAMKFEEKEVFDPYVPYFEVAGTYGDIKRFNRYVLHRLDGTSIDGYKKEIPESVRYGIERTFTSIAAVAVTTTKYKHMSAEELLIPRIIEVSCDFSKEWMNEGLTEEDKKNPTTVQILFKDVMDSVQEAAQRQPYLTTVSRAAGVEVFGKERKEGLEGAVGALVATGTNAVVRFTVKQAPSMVEQVSSIMDITPTGKEIVEWTNKNVPEIAQNVAKEVAVAGLTVGLFKLGKSCYSYCPDACCIQ